MPPLTPNTPLHTAAKLADEHGYTLVSKQGRLYLRKKANA